ncbi:unnamed protein product [Angiostrongylus costaricensis]|uniref:Uncharacterized protein n=1 Tax=Angiostrongylus costaricensis TaxID=334426 RepID=A0A0R3Q0A2_ANGCS|nr:unnamed protein product [Angiostrongylus costaricensis]
MPSSSDMRVFSLNQTRDTKETSDAKFLRATKRFFKKIYTTATFPNKKVSLDAESHFQKALPLFDNGEVQKLAMIFSSRGSVLKNDTDFSRIEDFQNYSQTYIDTSYPDSGLDLDRYIYSAQLFRTFLRILYLLRTFLVSNIFLHSFSSFQFRDVHAMRARDAAILADLHRVESQIQSVKLARLGVYGVATQQQPVQSLPI